MDCHENGFAYEVSVVIPCLNEAKTIGTCIEKALRAFDKHGLRGEVVVADNGSTDGSPELAASLGVRIEHVRERGYGAALMGGFAAAKGRYLVMGDADDTYDFSELFAFVEKLRLGYDMVIGCRFPKGGGTIMAGAMPWKNRYIGNPSLSFIGRLLFRSPVKDFHCGLRAIDAKAYRRLDLHTTGMEFASELIIKARLLKMKVTEVPITLYPNPVFRTPHLRPWRDGWRHLSFMLMYSPRWLFLVPGVLLCLVSLLLGGVLLAGPLTLGTVIFDTNTLLVSAMVLIVGVELILFALFTKIYALGEGYLPSDPLVERFVRVFRLEHGLLAGCTSSALGLALLVSAVLYWQSSHFGRISYPDSLRIVIPGITLITLGIQLIFASFFIGILRVRHK